MNRARSCGGRECAHACACCWPGVLRGLPGLPGAAQSLRATRSARAAARRALQRRRRRHQLRVGAGQRRGLRLLAARRAGAGSAPPMHGQGAEHAQPDRDCAIPHRHRQHAADHALGRTPNAFALGILCSRQLYHRHAERAGDRRRLHVRLDDPRRRRPRIHRQLGCRAVHRGAARRLHRHAAVHRGAAAQSRALHRAGGRRIALPRARACAHSPPPQRWWSRSSI